ncbi:MAG: 30S ribosomal protein S4 [Candidatus Brennerbacteria bacterium CG_4_10_14_0_2_um_filter_43_14]|nr:MAG: 30S ribosomal protein S4 [Candidatus Brennerbacteria bacterium CG_4_10_14_0_2_um_filter_43_14]
MAFILGPKEKKNRAVGEYLQLKAERSLSQKSAMIRKPYRPGMHGKRRRMMSEYALQLAEKQKIRLAYGLSERRMKRYASDATRNKIISKTDCLVRGLESRLDNTVFRAGFAPSRSIARQLVSHGHILVNNKRVTISSYAMRRGDIITVSGQARKTKAFSESLETIKKHIPPAWIKTDPDALRAEVVGVPTLEQSGINFNIPLILEFYSR